MGRRPQLSLVLFFYSFLTGALIHYKHVHNHHQVRLPMYAVGKKGWNSIENCFRKFRKKYTDGGMCLNIVSIVYFTLYFSIKYITQIALSKNSSLAKSWSKLNTKRKLDLVDPFQMDLQWHQWCCCHVISMQVSEKLIKSRSYFTGSFL